MTARRVQQPNDPVTLHLDGERVTAERGEPIAQALVAADKLLLARSPKLHRPRGPSCMRAACDGCLARVDGIPNVMTCLAPARDGARIETQNVLGTRTIDLLRVTDWFFPDGFDHHHFLAGIPGVSPLMQTIARRVAGLGVMPTTTKPRGKGEELSVDALVIGGGASGIACASALSRAGKTTLLADDALSLGGSMGALAPSLLRDLLTRHPLDRVDVRAHATVVGVFDGTALLASSEGASLIHPRAIVLATGGHDGVAVFEGNDVPGVFSARAAARLARAGVAIGARVVLAGDGPYATALASALDGVSDVTRVAMDDVLRVEGQTRVGGVVVRAGGEERRLRADALAVAAPVSPSYELIEQVGGRVKWVPHRGFFPVAEPNGAIAEDAFVTGELCGVAFDADALSQSGTRVAEAVLARLG